MAWTSITMVGDVGHGNWRDDSHERAFSRLKNQVYILFPTTKGMIFSSFEDAWILQITAALTCIHELSWPSFLVLLNVPTVNLELKSTLIFYSSLCLLGILIIAVVLDKQRIDVVISLAFELGFDSNHTCTFHVQLSYVIEYRIPPSVYKRYILTSWHG